MNSIPRRNQAVVQFESHNTYRKFHHQSVHYATNNCDKVECIPRILEVALER